MKRGISGGERKRLAVAAELLGIYYLILVIYRPLENNLEMCFRV